MANLPQLCVSGLAGKSVQNIIDTNWILIALHYVNVINNFPQRIKQQKFHLSPSFQIGFPAIVESSLDRAGDSTYQPSAKFPGEL